jgi:hypothetical protein
MGLFTTDIKSMEDLFLHTLRDVYYAEKQIGACSCGGPRQVCGRWDMCSG